MTILPEVVSHKMAKVNR